MIYIKARDSNIEILRIIAIIMVIGLHYLNENMGGALGALSNGHINYYIAHYIESLNIVAVNLFVIVSAYFLVDKSIPKLSKIIKLVILAYFYGFLFYIIGIISNINKFSFIELIKSINPFLDGGYWFIKIYIILYLLSPFINKFISTLNKKSHKGVIILIGIFFSVWPSFLPQAPNNDGGYGIISFIFLYLIVAYIKKYYKNNKSTRYYIGIYFLAVSITFIFSIISFNSAWAYNFVFNIIGSIALFLGIKQIKLKSNIINYIATYTFEIYLIHFNNIMIILVFKGLLRCKDFYYSKLFIINLVGGIITIFLISFIIEFIRRMVINLIDKLIPNRLKLSIKSIENKFNISFCNLIYGNLI
ncbi:MAG: acyltransferase family protein [Clostridium perfringens]|nr:acyltransferase family protein [Clostridium perfringens]